MNISLFSFPVNLESIFKAQNQNLLTINIGRKSNDQNIINLTESNILATFAEIKKEFEALNFYNAPTSNEEYLTIRTAMQSRAQNEMKRVASAVGRASGAYGSHVIQATMVVKEKVDAEVKELADKFEKNKKKHKYIVDMIDAAFQKWSDILSTMKDDRRINDAEYKSLLDNLELQKEGLIQSINIKLL